MHKTPNMKGGTLGFAALPLLLGRGALAMAWAKAPCTLTAPALHPNHIPFTPLYGEELIMILDYVMNLLVLAMCAMNAFVLLPAAFISMWVGGETKLAHPDPESPLAANDFKMTRISY